MLQNIQDKFNASNDFVKHANHFSLFPVDELCEPPLVKNVEVYDLLTPGKEQPLHISLYQMPKKIKKKTSIQINSYRFFFKDDLVEKMQGCGSRIRWYCANPDDDFIYGPGNTVLSHEKSGGTLFEQMKQCKKALDTYRLDGFN